MSIFNCFSSYLLPTNILPPQQHCCASLRDRDLQPLGSLWVCEKDYKGNRFLDHFFFKFFNKDVFCNSLLLGKNNKVFLNCLWLKTSSRSSRLWLFVFAADLAQYWWQQREGTQEKYWVENLNYIISRLSDSFIVMNAGRPLRGDQKHRAR